MLPTNSLLSVFFMKESLNASYYGSALYTNLLVYDDRSQSNAGEKFTDADLIGCPLRITLSKRTLARNECELKARNSDKVSFHTFNQVVEVVKNMI